MLLRKQTKHSKSEEEGSDESPVKSPPSTSVQNRTDKSSKQLSKPGEPLAKKKRRGRPPGITGRKPNQGYKIHNHAAANAKKTANLKGEPGQSTAQEEDNRMQEEEDIMAGITAEKALQYNIVLQDINRKIKKASWISD